MSPVSTLGRTGLGVGVRGKMVLVSITAPNGQSVACEFPAADARNVIRALSECAERADADTSSAIQVVGSFPTRRRQ